MGVVYTSEQIKHHDIPMPGAHQRAGAFVLAHLAKLYKENTAFRGGMIYGSTTTMPSVRSDLDVLTIFDADTVTPDDLEDIDRLSLQTHEAFHTQSEINMLLLNEHSTPDDHNLDSLFGMHLHHTIMESPKWAIGDPEQHIPLEPLTPSSALQILNHYSTHKERRFLKSLRESLSGEIDYAALQRAFELPSSLGRKAVTALRYEQMELSGTEYNREQLSETGETLLVSHSHNDDAIQAHRYLATMNKEYSTLLDDALAGRIPEQQYQAWITGVSRPALQNARILATAWKTFCESQRQR